MKASDVPSFSKYDRVELRFQDGKTDLVYLLGRDSEKGKVNLIVADALNGKKPYLYTEHGLGEGRKFVPVEKIHSIENLDKKK